MSKELVIERGLTAAWIATLIRCGYSEEVAHNRARQLFEDLGRPVGWDKQQLITAERERRTAEEMKAILATM